jgi:hypothetical protein
MRTKKYEVNQIRWAISEPEHANRNVPRLNFAVTADEQTVRLGLQNLMHRTHTTVHTDAQNTHHSPH